MRRTTDHEVNEHIQDVSMFTKHTQEIRTVIKVAIGVIFFAVVAIAGWQIHVNIVERNDNQTSQSSLLPSVAPTSFPSIFTAESFKYLQQFLDESISNETLYKMFPHRSRKLIKFEKDIRRFMDQKQAIQQLFRNVRCPQHNDVDDVNSVDDDDIDLDDFDIDDFQVDSVDDVDGDDDDDDQLAEWLRLISSYTPMIYIAKEEFEYDSLELRVDIFDYPDICITDNKGNILQLTVSGSQCDGTVDLTSLPQLQSLEILQLDNNQFTGTVDLTSLPQSLKELKLFSNQFDGTVNLTSLPQSLTTLWLHDNHFTGGIDLSSLSEDLEQLFLHINNFSGTVDLTLLSQASQLEFLHLGSNQFTGSVNLTSLPQSLAVLGLEGNQFTGSVDLTSLPALMECLWLNENQFTGSLDQTKLPDGLYYLETSDNQFITMV